MLTKHAVLLVDALGADCALARAILSVYVSMSVARLAVMC